MTTTAPVPVIIPFRRDVESFYQWIMEKQRSGEAEKRKSDESLASVYGITLREVMPDGGLRGLPFWKDDMVNNCRRSKLFPHLQMV